MTLIRTAAVLVAVVWSAASLASCETTSLPPTTQQEVIATTQQYTLGPGDRIRVAVFGENDLSGEYLVESSGYISLPLAGDILARGQTPSQLEAEIQGTLAKGGLVKNPKVSAAVVAYRPFYVLGEVSKPGQYPFVSGMTLTKAVASAGGFTYRANEKLVYITREGSPREQPVELTAAGAVGPGDTIRVAERHF